MILCTDLRHQVTVKKGLSLYSIYLSPKLTNGSEMKSFLRKQYLAQILTLD